MNLKVKLVIFLNSMVRIISFSGRKHSGKTLLCEISKQYGFTTMYFADALKNLICEMMSIERHILETTKDTPQTVDLSNCISLLAERLELDKLTTKELLRLERPFSGIREIMQYIGTDLIRKYCPNWHIDQLEKRIKDHKGDKICVGDCRFKNEKECIERLGGECWIIVRPTYFDDISNHSSEIDLQWPMFGERVIVNEKSKEFLQKQWEMYMETNHWTPSSYLKMELKEELFDAHDLKRAAKLIDNPLILENYKLKLK
jgi:dephospho-CoA kinase